MTTAPITVRLLQPTANLGLTDLTLTPGLIDDQAREMFLYSQCQMLALAICERTGWPVWVAEQQLPAGYWSWSHAGVRTPAGRWLDIKGPRDGRDVAAWLAGWGLPVRLRVLSPATWHETFSFPSGTSASWWRSRVTDPDGNAAGIVEDFAALLIELEREAVTGLINARRGRP